MEKVRMEEVETMAVELLPDREEMQASVSITTVSFTDNAGAGQTAGQGVNVAVNED
jgi:hypothetical protein